MCFESLSCREVEKDKIWGVELVTSQRKLNGALSSEGRYVAFDGHSNLGLGPEFPNIDVLGHIVASRIQDFTNYGVRFTDIPFTHRRRVDENGFITGQLNINNADIPIRPINYRPQPINRERFPNADNVRIGQIFRRQGQGLGSWHYSVAGGARRLMIIAPRTDLPPKLAYKTFFYNACNTGLDYIENFGHGDFIYTTRSCFVHRATSIYVRGIVEGRTTAQILPRLNQRNVGTNQQGVIVYEFRSF